MSREKQINELANDLNQHCADLAETYCGDTHCVACLANALYNAGYRKQSVGEWIAKDNINGRCSIATCSNCGTEKAFSIPISIETVTNLYPYCQKCGASMKGGAK